MLYLLKSNIYMISQTSYHFQSLSVITYLIGFGQGNFPGRVEAARYLETWGRLQDCHMKGFVQQ
jgi:hypothetical protein